MRFLCGILLSVMLAVPVFAESRLNFETYGFSIDNLQVPSGDKGDVFQTVMMFLPASDGFAPNVNILIQKFSGTVAEYLKISETQFTAAQAVVINKKQTDKNLILEYTVNMNGKDIHVYSKAIFDKDVVYLASGTSLVSQWKSVGTVLKKNVDSIQLVGVKK